MTRDEVMALSYEELRGKAAELAGWECRPCDEGCATNIAVWPWMKDGVRGLPPDYPHDIAAAWELVPRDQPLAIAQEWVLALAYMGDVAMCDAFEWLLFTCPEPPRAITRAFVIAMTAGEQ